MAGFLLVNPRSGGGSPDADELCAEATRRGLGLHLMRPGEDAGKVARAAEADVLGVAGGDGSLAPVAEAAIERGVPFVCVPFGTRNHFARDVGLDRNDPIGALDAFRDGRELAVDVGRAGDRIFLNNVSLGLYAQLVHRREGHRRRRELFARLRALSILATHRDPLGITVDGEPLDTRILLVANNAYSVDLLSVGERERLDGGALHLYVPRGLLRADWVERSAERFVVDAREHRLRAAIDGEPERVDTPLELRIEPRALRVLVPR